MYADLRGKNALVCGATQGIGFATAIGMAQAGARVTLFARNAESAQKAVDLLPAVEHGKHDYLLADFDYPHQIVDNLRPYVEKGQVFHIVVNNSGGPPGGALTAAAIEEFTTALSRHLFSAHAIAQLVLPGMQESSYGRIINIVSTSVKQPIPGLGVSNTTRGAVASWAKTLAGEVGKFGVTVNSILPGATRTGRLESIIKRKSEQKNIAEEHVIAEEVASIPLGRFAEPEEIANLAVFLASPLAAYISGTAIPVDGGRTMCL